MQQYLFRRIGLAFLALIALSILTFLLVRSERYEVQPYYWDAYYVYDAEEPSLVVQYTRYTKDLFQGNWDKAWGLERGSGNIVLERLPTTLRLAALALAVSAVLGITLGVLAAINKGTPFDRWSNMVVSFGQSMPIFWLGVALVGVAAYLPVGYPSQAGAISPT